MQGPIVKESLVKDSLANLIEAHATIGQFQRTIDTINEKENLKKRNGDCFPIDDTGREKLRCAKWSHAVQSDCGTEPNKF
jgi:hypothetical protein